MHNTTALIDKRNKALERERRNQIQVALGEGTEVVTLSLVEKCTCSSALREGRHAKPVSCTARRTARKTSLVHCELCALTDSLLYPCLLI